MLPVHQICKAPVVVLNLQPTAQINYPQTTTGEWLAHCGACPVPEIANAFNRPGIAFRVVNGLLGLDYTPVGSLTNEVTNQRWEAKRAWRKNTEWIRAASVVRTLRSSRFGFLGNTYSSGMLDLYSDFTLLQAKPVCMWKFSRCATWNEYDLDALCYYYHGAPESEYERLQAGFIVGHSLLTARGIP